LLFILVVMVIKMRSKLFPPVYVDEKNGDIHYHIQIMGSSKTKVCHSEWSEAE